MTDSVMFDRIPTELPAADGIFTAIYERNVRRVYRLCYLKLGHREDAEDAVQNVFLRYLQMRENSHKSEKKPFASEEHERAYFLRAAINECINVQKSRWRVGRCDMEELPDAVVSVSEEEAFAQSALNDGIPSILQKLPAMYREVLYLYYCEELSAKTVARLLSRRESTVRTQLQTGRALLRGIIEKGESK